MIELLARFRPNESADQRLAEIGGVEPEGVALNTDGTEPPHEAIREFLSKQSVARCLTSEDVLIVRINEASVLSYLNSDELVRRALDQSGLGTREHPAELDGGTIRLKGKKGRLVTQAVSRAIYEDDARPGGIRYFSRLDDTQECWALFDRVTVEFEDLHRLAPDEPAHREAVRRAAETLMLDLPDEWSS